jgi:BASS family bile acid:Na+ symporter
VIERFLARFPLWISGASLIALFYPAAFSWFITGQIEWNGAEVELHAGGFVTPGLQIIMLAMGLTLQLEDFRAALEQKAWALLGVVLQFTIMPALGFALGHLFGLDDALRAGLILVCCCPGGTASNVIAFLARADVALSVAMTAISTLLAAFLTPTLSALLIGAEVRVDVTSLYLTTAEVVLLPVVSGVLLRRYAERFVRALLPVLPSVAVIAIVLIVAGIIAVQHELVLSSGLVVLATVTLTHGLAFLLAYWIAIFRGASRRAARTISIEVGMQNSGLGVVLARSCFADPLVAVTPAISAVIHCLYGSGAVALWGRSKEETLDGEAKEVSC